MPENINAISPRDYTWAVQPAEREDFRATMQQHADDARYGVCAAPTTVIGAAFCGDETSISNACRRAKLGTVDDFLCDDSALEKVQEFFVDIAQKDIQLVLGARMGLTR
jgi:hypothetical protein